MTQTFTSKTCAIDAAVYQTDGFVVVPNLITPTEVRDFLAYNQAGRPPERDQGLRSHTVDPQWAAIARHPRIVEIIRQLVGGPPQIVQTMYLAKPAAGGKGIALHQDTHYLPHAPNTLVACWLALTDTDGDNGGLCVVPGSHRWGLQKAGKNEDVKEHVSGEKIHTMRDRDGRTWEQNIVSFSVDVPEDGIVRLAVPAGSGVFFTGLTIHGSFANHSPDRPRVAFATHYVREGTWVYRTDVQETTPA